MTVETCRIFSTRLTLSASASRVAVEARCNLSRAVCFECGGVCSGGFCAETLGACFGGGASLAVCISAAGATMTCGGEVMTALAGSFGTDAGGDACASSLALGPNATSGVFARGLPHCGQNSASSRYEAPQAKHRREISGCTIRLRISDCELLIRNHISPIDYQQSLSVFKSAIRNSQSDILKSDASHGTSLHVGHRCARQASHLPCESVLSIRLLKLVSVTRWR